MQPVQMTRAEYEAKFGVKPVATSTSEIDTLEPVPVRMTRAEYQALYRPSKPSFLQDLRGDIQETGTAMTEAVNRGAETAGQIEQRIASGETTKPEGLFQKFGTGLGTVTNTLFQGALGVAKAVLPQSAEEGASKFFSEFGEAINEKNKRFYETEIKPALESEDPQSREIAQNLVSIAEAYKTDPNFRSTVEAAGGIVDWLALPGASKAVLTKSAGAVGDITTQARLITDDVVTNFANSRQDVRVQNVADEIANIENRYIPTRRRADLDPNVDESRLRIAQSNVLEKAVDTDGLIRTKERGGAVDTYRELTIDGMEDVVRRNLELEGRKMNLKELEADMRIALTESGLEGADLVSALKKVEKEIQGLALRADEFGDILLDRLQDAKIATTKHIDYTKPVGTTYRKTVARVLKEAIERKSGLNVREINTELAKYYNDLERLASLDGKRVKGGRLGKYTSQLAGSAIGGVAGSAGGAAGAVVGGILGGEVSTFLAGKSMQSTFRKGVLSKDITNPILAEAKARADAGIKDLRTPDRPVGAPKALLDNPNLTPEIRAEIQKVEGQIKNNIKQQNSAIKAGDFGLVEELKKVYQILVAKLAEIVRVAKENLENPATRQGGFIGNSPFQRDRQLNQTNAITTPTTAQSISDTVTPDATDVKGATPSTNLLEEAKKYKSAGIDISKLPKEILDLDLTDSIPSNELIRTPGTGEIYYNQKLVKKFKEPSQAMSWLDDLEDNPEFQKLIKFKSKQVSSSLRKKILATAKKAKTFDDVSKNSKVKETVYHGTSQPDFIEFVLGKSDNTGTVDASEAVWFTNNKSSAKYWSEYSEKGGGRVLESKIMVENPKYVDGETIGGQFGMLGEINMAKAEGYDSLIIDQGGGDFWYAVFEPEKTITKQLYESLK